MVIMLLIGCKISKVTCEKTETKKFFYVLPLEVEEEVYRLIRINNFQGSDLFFQLRRVHEDYQLLITPTKNINREYFGYFKVANSNRCVLVNNKSYPLVFEDDYVFGSLIGPIESLQIRKEKYNSGENEIARGPYSINEHTVGVRFKRSGEILR